MLSILEKTGTEHNEETSNEMVRILDMKPISIKKHEWTFANMVPISITKHRMIFWEF